MNRCLLGLMTLASFSANASESCVKGLVHDVLSGQVGRRHSEIMEEADRAHRAGDRRLHRKKSQQELQIMEQIVNLAKKACE